MHFPIRTALLVLVLIAATRPAVAQSTSRQEREAKQARQAALVAAVTSEGQATIAALRADGDFDAARVRIDALFDRAITYVPLTEEGVFRDLAFARRLVRHVGGATTQPRGELLAYLLDNQAFARALVFTMHPEHDKPNLVFHIVNQLRQQRGPHLDKFATLAAAICIVHDRSKPMVVNENTAKAPNPVAVFDFYAGNEGRMMFGIRNMPTELLVYVVDVSASINDMKWALNRYAGDRNIGKRFFDIVYDYGHLKGAEKDVTRAGWNLPNILKYGGVCADQAYFAVTVGKSIGVPATYTRGKSAQVSHAWVGFLKADRKQAWWDFNSGRYEDYKNARGTVLDPQTRLLIPDSTVSLLAAHVQSSVEAREFTAAMTDACQRLAEARTDDTFAPAPFTEENGEPLRNPTIDHALDLLKAGLQESPGSTAGWFTLQSLSRSDDFTSNHREEWGRFLHKLCGRRYQDFYLQIVRKMIESIDDPQEQNRIWNTAFKNFSNRPDLAASVRLAQGRMWMKHDQLEKAGNCFEDVIVRYANAGPFAVDAVNYAASILRKLQDGRRLLALYETSWNRMQQPKEKWAIQFAKQSNWYRVGYSYAKVLDEAGRRDDANRVRAELRRNISVK